VSKITDAWEQLGIIQRQRFEQATGATPLRLTDAERRDLAIAADAYEQTTVGQMLFYARRAGYLEGALRLIAEGRTGVRPRVAAKRALKAVGTDRLVNGTQPTHRTPGEGSEQEVRSVRESTP